MNAFISTWNKLYSSWPIHHFSLTYYLLIKYRLEQGKRSLTFSISFPVIDCFFFLFPYFRRKRSPGSTSTGDGDSFLKTVYSVESEYSNNKIESIPIRKEDFIIPGFPNLTTGTETLLFQAGNRELLFGTAFDLRLAATIKVFVGVFSIRDA